MPAPRLLMACFTAAVLLVMPATAAEEPNTEPTLRDVISRLDKTLQRLDQIEQRIARLEGLFSPAKLTADKHGILRDESGRAIGAWGIDYPTTEERAVR